MARSTTRETKAKAGKENEDEDRERLEKLAGNDSAQIGGTCIKSGFTGSRRTRLGHAKTRQ